MATVAQTSNIRSAHRDLTRTRILDAAIDLLRTEELDRLTIADVALKAGVTDRTVYRHFATRDELLTAVWPAMQARLKSRGFPMTAKALLAQPTRMFENFDAEEGAVRASVFSRAGRELRMSVNDRRQAAMRSCVRDARPDFKEPELTRMAAVVQLLSSAYAWAVMKDFWDLDAEQSGLACSEAIAALLQLKLRLPLDAESISSKEYLK